MSAGPWTLVGFTYFIPQSDHVGIATPDEVRYCRLPAMIGNEPISGRLTILEPWLKCRRRRQLLR
jgi:hypothetical protein